MDKGYIYKIRNNATQDVMLPVTVGDAVMIGNMTLSNYLNLNVAKNEYLKTAEQGLYICDENGYYIAQFDQDGLNATLSEQLKSTISDVISNSPMTIDEAAVTKIANYKRLTDGGWLTSPIMVDVVYLGDLTAGDHQFTIDADGYVMKDYFKMTLNTQHTITNIQYNSKSITVNISTTMDSYDVFARIEYCVMTYADYDKVLVSLQTSNSEALPEFARVKYNKLCPYVWTSDDMGLSEYTGCWCLFNGYATGCVTETYPNGVDVLNGVNMGSEYPIHRPLTYTDGAGKKIRYTATSAIFPQDMNSSNYTKMDKDDAIIMIRLRQSFAQHDVQYADSIERIAEQYKTLSDKWEQGVGVGLKVMIEPNGNKNYVRAVNISDEMAFALMQNTRTEDPDIGGLSPLIDDWRQGRDITSYRRKPSKALIRAYMGDTVDTLASMVANADGTKILATGSHGMPTVFKEWMMTTLSKRDDIWVTSTDELWEYYHLTNHSIIDNLVYDADTQLLSFDIIVPKYSKSQFRELTINLPITDGTECIVSGAITSSHAQNDSQYTINIGVSSLIQDHIQELIDLLRENATNSCIRRDCQYLIDLLCDNNALKQVYQNALDSVNYARYTVSIMVYDQDGAAISGATGSLSIDGQVYSRTSLTNGDLTFSDIPAGSATVSILADGFTTQTVTFDITRCVEIDVTMV